MSVRRCTTDFTSWTAFHNRSIDGLLEMRLRAQAKRLDAKRTLWVLQGALDVPFLVVKGPVLSSYWYADGQVREFSDLDVLVAPADFGRVVDVLFEEGAMPRATNWHGFRRLEVAEIPLALGATTIDLHWDLVALGEDRRDIRLPVHELFDDSVEVQVGERDVRTLCPVDTLLHLCVNAGLDGAHRLRSLIDVDTVVRSGRVDLDEFAARAGRRRSEATLLRCPATNGEGARNRASRLVSSAASRRHALGSSGTLPSMSWDYGRSATPASHPVGFLLQAGRVRSRPVPFSVA